LLRLCGGGAETNADLFQLVGEPLLAGELVLFQSEQQLLVVLHSVPATAAIHFTLYSFQCIFSSRQAQVSSFIVKLMARVYISQPVQI
jgi:hypothetical protein